MTFILITEDKWHFAVFITRIKERRTNMNGTLYGIGVGPGDPELITLKAYRTLQACRTFVFPSKTKEDCYAYQIAVQICPEIDEREQIFFDFPMKKDKEELAHIHDAIYEKIRMRLSAGADVAFLTIGDPTVYSTFGYIQKRAIADEKKVSILSGIPSFCAACARLGIALAEGKEQIHIIPGSYEIKESLKLPGTKVYMKAGKKLSELKQLLLESDMEKMEVYAVSNCGLPGEKLFYSSESLTPEEGYLTLVIVKEKKEQK